ncbi:hypothetical protein CMO88_05175 [Candidatus Woesearchaeota archaeon]|nr:hypothetical protein [Candidatus Woesearchaeota archaeon]|tara:strand:- start:5662 stop:6213 length:552 start_codon:yes stop_codon:yes gene_type:complete
MLAEINEIKILRKHNNLTQGQLSKLAGVSQSLIAKLEAGMIDPSYSNFRKLHEVLTSIGEKKEPKAGDVVSDKILSVGKNDSLSEAIRKMKNYGISQLPVTEKENVIGLVAESDVIESIHQGKDIKKLKASDVMEDSPPTVPVKTPLKVVTELLRVSQLVVVTDKGKAKGVITKADVLNKLAK